MADYFLALNGRQNRVRLQILELQLEPLLRNWGSSRAYLQVSHPR